MAPCDEGAAFTRAWCAAVGSFFREGEPELATLLAFYDEGVRFQDPLGTRVGLAAFAEMNRRFLRRCRAVDVAFGDLAEGPGTAFAAWTMRVVPRLGPTVRVPGVSHLSLAGGRIVAHTDSFDLGGSVADALHAGALYRALARAIT